MIQDQEKGKNKKEQFAAARIIYQWKEMGRIIEGDQEKEQYKLYQEHRKS